MSSRGISFLEDWIDVNVGEMGQPADPLKAAFLGRKLIADAAASDLTIEDMNLEDYSIKEYILEAMTAMTDRHEIVGLPPGIII
jgi:hypothetical protein